MIGPAHGPPAPRIAGIAYGHRQLDLRPRSPARRKHPLSRPIRGSLCGGRNHRGQRFPFGKSHRRQRPFLSPPDVHEHLANQVRRLCGQAVQIQPHFIPPDVTQASLGHVANHGADQRLRLTGQFSQPQQGVYDRRVVVRGQERQEFVADPVSCEARVAIAGIGAERLLTIAEIRDQFGTPRAEQRPQQRRRAEPPCPRHAAQAAGARTAQDAMQDGFGLIVGRVRRDDKACPHPPGDLLQRGIPSPPRGGLDSRGHDQDPEYWAPHRMHRRPTHRPRPSQLRLPAPTAGKAVGRSPDRPRNPHLATYDSRGRRSIGRRPAISARPDRRAGPRYRLRPKPRRGPSNPSNLAAATPPQGGFPRGEAVVSVRQA